MTAAPPPEFSVVLAAHDEASNIAPIGAALTEVLAPLGRYEIIFVDDGSVDGTLSAIRAAAARDAAVRYIAFTRNFGHEAALRAGLRHARGRAVILMDADFEHPPEVIPDLVSAWRQGAKIVAANRLDSPELPWFKRVTSRLFYRLLGALADIRMEAGSADFLLLDRVVVEVLNRSEEQDLFLRGMVRWLGYPLVSVKYKPGLRLHGVSKYSKRKMLELALTGIASHSVRPLRLAIYLALGFAFAGVLLMLYSFVSFFFIQRTVAGWTSIVATIALLGAAQLFVLGIIGEYVGRVLRETRRRPSYVVAETEADLQGDGSERAASLTQHRPSLGAIRAGE